jgi:alpha-glucoside transport system substrate-binding protein
MVLAACGGNNNGTAEPSGGGTTTGGGGQTGPTSTEGMPDLSGTNVSIFGAPTSVEADAINSVIDQYFNQPTGANAVYEGSDSFETQVKIRIDGGNPPDIAIYPQPGAVIEQAQEGNAVALEDMGFDIQELNDRFGEYLMGLGEYNGKHYGIPTNANLKSLIWYNIPTFEKEGYQIPETWADLMALSQQMVDDGYTPWSIGTGSDAATGWPATDWLEDIVLRQAGPDTYDQWVSHEIPFNDPAIKSAMETFGQVVFGDGFTVPKPANIPDVDFRDAPDAIIGDPPAALLHRQASFIVNFFPEGAEFGTDYGVFKFPSIDGNQGALIAGELAVVFADRPEVRAFIDTFTGKEAQCAQGSFEGVSRISPNVNTSADCYTNPVVATSADGILSALREGTARFDASDLMPPEVGSGSEWTGMNDWMRGKSIDDVLSEIEASWPTS